MRKRALFFLVCGMLLSALVGPEQVLAWRSELYPESWTPPTNRSFENDKLIQDFSYAGYRRGEAPIPTVAGPVFNVTQYGAAPNSSADSTVAIQKAIDAAKAAGGGVVYLPAGTYRVRPQGNNMYTLLIDANNIVLRGAGVNQTFILNTATEMRRKDVILVSGPTTARWTQSQSPSTAITANLLMPTVRIPVASVSGFRVGDRVILRADPKDDWANEHKETSWVGSDGAFGPQLYYREIKAIDSAAKVLTIDIPIRYYLKTRDNPRVHVKTGMLAEIGLEHFSIGNVQHPATTGWNEFESYNVEGHPTYDVHGSELINFKQVRDSWIRNVSSYQAPQNSSTAHMLSNGIELVFSHNITIANSTFQRAQFGGSGGNGYMFRLTKASENLLTETVAEYSRHGYSITDMAATGNVYHRCVDRITQRSTGSTGRVGTPGAGSDTHMYFSHSNLYDACVADDSFFDKYYRWGGTLPHGLSSAHGVIWNIEGRSPSRYAYVARSAQARYGYVIGTRGSVTDVVLTGAPTTKTNPIDHAEGIGQGASLSPFSLYQDQLARRLRGGPTPPAPQQPVAPTGLVVSALCSGRILAAAGSSRFSVLRDFRLSYASKLW